MSYNEIHDEIQGYQDYGYKRTPSLAQTVCVFMVRGLFSQWKFVLKYYAANTNISGSELKRMLYENLNISTAAGLTISAIICDQGSNNRKCFKSLNVSIDHPYFFYGEHKIYALYDICHIIKSIRNNLLNGTKFICPDGTVCWSVVQQLYNWERTSTTKVCPKLTSKHIYPNTFEKMRVRFATQIFSKSVVAGIKTAIDLKILENEELAISTSKCFDVLDKVFDCLNSKKLFSANPYTCALMEDNTVCQTLNAGLSYFKNTSYCGAKTIYCLNGLVQTISATLMLANDFFNNSENEISYILTNRLNQDALENLFAQVRYKGGNNKNPSLLQFNNILSHIVSSKLQFKSVFSNCETDDASFLLGEFNDEPTNTINPIDISEPIEPLCEIGQSITITTTLEENSMKYFVGYVVFKVMGKLKCAKCTEEMLSCDTVQLENEYFLYNKNYYNDNSFGSLKSPNQYFFLLCKLQIETFRKKFDKTSHERNLKSLIVESCVEIANNSTEYAQWFSLNNDCVNHRTKILNFMILVLIKKHCQWKLNNIKKPTKFCRNSRMRILQE